LLVIERVIMANAIDDLLQLAKAYRRVPSTFAPVTGRLRPVFPAGVKANAFSPSASRNQPPTFTPREQIAKP